MRRLIAAAALGLALGGTAWVPVAAGASEPTPSSTVVAVTDPTTTTVTTTTPTTAPPATTSTTATPPTSGSIGQANAAPAATVTVGTSGANCSTFCFSPVQTTISAGGTVTFTNPGPTDHTVKRCTPAACSGASGGTGTDSQFSTKTFALPGNRKVSYTFEQPGTYVYFCTLHGYTLMHGTITVIAAAPTTTLEVPSGAPTAPPSTALDPNALASTGGSPDPLIATASVLLVVGLAAIGLTARGGTERTQ